jgi:predicted metalloprotease with PDZ domain/beta-lactamase regulating signal transducer with metallopeptidase domain
MISTLSALGIAQHPLLERLLASSVELALLGVVIAAAVRLLQIRSPRLVSMLWLLVLAKAIVSLTAGSPVHVSLFTLSEPPANAVAPHAQEAVHGVDRARHWQASPPSLAGHDLDVRASTTVAPAPGVSEPSRPLLPPMPVLLEATWCLGVLVFALRYLCTVWRLRHLVRRSRAVPDEIAAQVHRIAVEVGLRAVPALRATRELHSPAVVGILEPVLLIPEWLAGRAPSQQLAWALRHELHHCRCHDPLGMLIRDLACILFFFHPVAWWAGRRQTLALEMDCDRAALRDVSEAAGYAEGLYAMLLAMRARRRDTGPLLAMASRGNAARRIGALLDGKLAAVRPLTRRALLTFAMVAAAVFALGGGIGRAMPHDPKPGAAAHDHDATGPTWARPPSVFVFGQCPRSLFDDLKPVLHGSVRSVWGRTHEKKIYDEFFLDPDHRKDLRAGDVVILLVSLDEGGQVPEGYADLLPLPAREIEERLRRGERWSSLGTAREVHVLVLAAPHADAFPEMIRGSKRIGTPPNVFVMGSGFQNVVDVVGSVTLSKTGRPHDVASYDEIFGDRSPGDLLVLLLRGDDRERVPDAYQDLLPRPWKEVDEQLRNHHPVEAFGRARGWNVVLLAAPTEGELRSLIRKTTLLGPGASEKPSSASVVPSKRSADLFILGPTNLADFLKIMLTFTRDVGSKTGRAQVESSYDELFADPGNPLERHPGDLLVLLFSLEAGDPPPERYRDLLPRPWEEIVAAMRRGESVELSGHARDLDVAVLATPKTSELLPLVQRTPKLERYRGEVAEGAPAPPQEGVLPAGARYIVTIDANDRRTAHVRLVLPAGQGEVPLSASSGAQHLPRGYVEFVSDVRASDASGQPVAVRETGPGRWSVALRDGAVTVEYQVALRHDEKPWPEGGPDEAPYATPDNVFWTGRALFLAADVISADVEIDVPEDWQVSAPWTPVEGRDRTYRVTSRADLTEAFLLAGSHHRSELHAGDTHIVLAIGRGLDAAQIEKVVQRLLEANQELMGGAPAGRKLLVANRGPWSGLNGGVFGNSISLLSDGDFDAASQARWVPFVAHEIFHLWNGGGGLRSRDGDPWFSEGFTEYYAHVICARLGLIDRSVFLERVRGACHAYLARAGSAALKDPGHETREMQYDGGFLAALCLDVELRRGGNKKVFLGTKAGGPALLEVKDRQSLDDLMRKLFARTAASGQTYTLDDIAQAAGELAGRDEHPFFDRYVTGREILPLAALTDAGLSIQWKQNAERLERAYAIHDVLHIRSLTETPQGLVVRKSAEAGFRDGDVLQAIGKVDVHTFGDLQRVLGSQPSQAAVELRVLRDGATTTMPLTLGGRENPPLERDLEVTVQATSSSSGGETMLDRILGG